MSPELQECEAQVMSLPINERAMLADHLITSLDLLNDSENERLWVDVQRDVIRNIKTAIFLLVLL